MTSLEKLSQVKDKFENKCVAVGIYIENITAEKKAISDARKRLQKREYAIKKEIEKMKEYLKYNMEKCDITKVSCEYFDVNLYGNSQSVDIYSADMIPDEYKKISVSFDKDRIKKELKKGEFIPGARLVNSKKLRIK